MDIKQLKYFLLVADMGGFTNAARAMGLGQSAISKQIKLLETEVGAQLFLRHGRGIVLTPAGRQLLDHARDITERIEVARADMSELSKSVAGEITCGLPASLGSTLTTPLLKRFLDSYPLVRLSLVEGLSGHLYEWLLRGDLDLAALYMPSVNNSLFSEFILSDQIYLVWANDGIPAPETIPFASQRNLKVNIRCQVDSIAAIRNLVLQGYGYALMPVSLIQSELEQGMVSCSRLVDPTLNRDLLLAMSPYTRNTPLTRTLRREIRQLVSDTTSGVLPTGP